MSWQDKALAAFWADAFANEPLDSHRRIEAAIAAAAVSLLPPKDAPMADHPITPPPELFKQWEGKPRSLAFEAAYRAGADAELEACCEWLRVPCPSYGRELRAERRPKPPSLAEQALALLGSLHNDLTMHGLGTDTGVIRRALERLQELEVGE